MNGPDRAMPTTPQGIARDLTLQVLSWGVQPQHLRPRLPDREDLERACLLEAIALREAGDPQRSLELIELALEHGLNDPWLLDNRARALRDLGQWQEPMRIWSELAQQHSDAALAQVASQMLADADLGHSCLHDVVAHLEAGDPQRSLELIELAREHGLDDPWLLDHRARALLALGQPEPALEIWSELSDHSDPTLAQVARQRLADSELRQVVLQQVIALRDDGDPQRSLELIELAREHGLDDPWLLDHRARALLALGQPEPALEIWSELASHNAGDGDGAQAGDRDLIKGARQMAAQVEQSLLKVLLAECGRWGWSPEHLTAMTLQDTEQQRPAEEGIEPLISRVLKEIVACRQAGQAELSLGLAKSSLEQGWNSPWLRDNEARALINLGRRSDAVMIWQELITSNDRAVAETAIEMLQLLAAEMEREQINSQLEQLRCENRFDEAISLLLSHWRRHPDTPKALPQITAWLGEKELDKGEPAIRDWGHAEVEHELATERRVLTALRLMKEELHMG